MRRANLVGRPCAAESSTRRCRMRILLSAALGVGLATAPASALTVGGAAAVKIDPVYFHLGGNFGLNTGPAFDFPVNAADDWRLVGQRDDLSFTINLQTPVVQNPQFPASSMNTLGTKGTPSTTNPFVADSIWTITNNTDKTLNKAYLVFEAVDLGPTALLPRGYPDILVGMDQNLSGFKIVKYTDLETESSFFFGALPLGTLGAKGSTQIRVRYIVAGALPQNGANLVMPPFTIAGLINVPEPGTLVLLAGGLVLFAAAGRRRCA